MEEEDGDGDNDDNNKDDDYNDRNDRIDSAFGDGYFVRSWKLEKKTVWARSSDNLGKYLGAKLVNLLSGDK